MDPEPIRPSDEKFATVDVPLPLVERVMRLLMRLSHDADSIMRFEAVRCRQQLRECLEQGVWLWEEVSEEEGEFDLDSDPGPDSDNPDASDRFDEFLRQLVQRARQEGESGEGGPSDGNDGVGI